VCVEIQLFADGGPSTRLKPKRRNPFSGLGLANAVGFKEAIDPDLEKELVEAEH